MLRALGYVGLLLIGVLVATAAHAQSSVQNYDRDACSMHGGVKGIARPFSYIGYYTRWPVANDGSSPCIRNCPQCIQYCYAYTVVCNDNGTVGRYSQVQPFVSAFSDLPTYTSESQQQAEWARIQAQQASSNYWRPLSPWPQLLILCCFMAISGIAWFGRHKNGTGVKAWELNIPFNLYFALSLFTFNTSGDSDSLAQMLDGNIFFHSGLFVCVVFAFVAINAMSLIRGCNYLFVRHPAANIVNTAVDHGKPIHGKSLVRALWVSPQELFWRRSSRRS